MDQTEKSRRFIQSAIELALSLGDFQQEVDCHCTSEVIAEIVEERIATLINFESSALYLVDEESSDVRLSVCRPAEAEDIMEAELDFLIQTGFVAWAIRERRGITVYSKNGRHQVLLHSMSTVLRTRGLFIGIFPERMRRLPDASLEILSIILRNAANAIESLTYANMLREQKLELEKLVKERTRRLVHYEKQLMQARHMETVAALAGGVAHQFNNALTGLVGNLDLIDMAVEDGSDTSRYLGRTRPIIERMTGLTNQLLAYAQGGKYLASAISLNNLIVDTLPVIRRTIKPTVAFDTSPIDETLTVKVDVIQMRMAILAIVSNADEAIEGDGDIQLRTFSVTSEALPEALKDELGPGQYVCICIRDNGKGMDDKTLQRIFEPFYSTKFEGRGLSMAAVFGIIKNHDGWVAVRSEPGQGTEVQVYLPIVPPGKAVST